MKRLTYLFFLMTLVSCSTVKRNGYLQTRKYSPGKHLVKEVKNKLHIRPSFKIHPIFNEERHIARTQIEPKSAMIELPNAKIGDEITPLPSNISLEFSSAFMDYPDISDSIYLLNGDSLNTQAFKKKLKRVFNKTYSKVKNVEYVTNKINLDDHFSDDRIRVINTISSDSMIDAKDGKENDALTVILAVLLVLALLFIFWAFSALGAIFK